MTQYGRPVSDVTNTFDYGGWADLDEVSASDSDYAGTNDNTTGQLEVALTSTLGDPVSSSGHIVRVRLAKADTGVPPSTDGNTQSMTVTLYQGTTSIATVFSGTVGAWAQTDYTLSAGEADSITDYTDLRVRVDSPASGGGPTGNRRGGAVSWIVLEIPDESTDKTGSFGVTGGGVYTHAREKGAEAGTTLTGGGVYTAGATKGAEVGITLTGGGVYTHAFETTSTAKSGSFTVTGGGVYAQGAQKGGQLATTATGGGVYAQAAAKEATSSITATGGGAVVWLHTGGHTGTMAVTGGGVITWEAEGPMALNDLGGVMDALAVAVKTNAKIKHVYAYPVDTLTPPCAVVAYPETIDFDVTFQAVGGEHTDRTVIPVYFVAGQANTLAARDTITGVIRGAFDLKMDIEADATLLAAVQTVRVTDCRITEFTAGGVSYLAARFDCEVLV